jgi:hypothetical protein
MTHEEALLSVYNIYPNKQARRAALLEIERAIKRLTKIEEGPMTFDEAVQGLIQAVTVFAKSPAGQCNGLFNGYYPPHPSTWFHQSRYLDSPEVWFNVAKPESTATVRGKETSAALDRAFETESVPGDSLSIFQDNRERRRGKDLERIAQRGFDLGG